jgi:hypothetical protein
LSFFDFFTKDSGSSCSCCETASGSCPLTGPGS